MTKRKYALIISSLILVVLYGVRLYNINHSHVLEYMPNKVIYESGTRVEMPAGYYNNGYADLTGYYLEAIDSRLLKTSDFLSEYGYSMDVLENLYYSQDYQYVFLVTVTFDYEGEGDPTQKVIDLSDFKLVGLDYYFDCSVELNQLNNFNPILNGRHAFAIGSKKQIELTLPFLINTESEWSVSADYLLRSNPKLLISMYPDEVYLSLSKNDNLSQTSISSYEPKVSYFASTTPMVLCRKCRGYGRCSEAQGRIAQQYRRML